jgi:hypothetical protein
LKLFRLGVGLRQQFVSAEGAELVTVYFKHDAWLTGELEEDFDPSRHVLVFGSMRASGEFIEYS